MPDWPNEIRRRLAPLGLSPAHEAEIIEEMAQHMDDRYAELLGRGLAPDAAHRAVLAELEERHLTREELERGRPAFGLPPQERGSALAMLANDVRYAVRTLRANPGFATVALLTLSLSIGACTLIFTAVHGVLLRPLPYRDSHQLVTFWGTAPEKNLPVVAFPDGLFHVYHDQTRTLESLAAYDGGGFNYTADGAAERIEGAAVTLDFFRVFDVAPIIGRTFAAGEDNDDVSRVVVLSHALWRRRFGGRPDVVGKMISLSSSPMTVIGVMPEGFDFPGRGELWVPLRLDRNAFNCWCYFTVGRMRPGRTVNDVRREIESISDDFALRRRDVFPDAKRGGSRIVAMTLAERIVGSLERPLLVLLAAVGIVLLIACANTANLMLARAATRAREMAVRCCLGASPRRIASQLLTESALLSVTGALLGALVATWGVRAMRALPPAQFPRMSEIAVDPAVLAFTIAVAVVTSVLCGLAPALRAARVDLSDVLKAGTRSSATTGARRLRDTFVVTQFALSLVLLVGAGLLLRSYRHLLDVDPGYKTRNVLVARLTAPYPRYDDAAVTRFYGQLHDRLASVGGLGAIGIASRVPLTPNNPQNNLVAEGREPKPGEPVLVANIRSVTPGYFDAIGTPLLQGRLFEPTDDERHPRVAVVDETLARHFWPTGSALGKRIRYQGDTSATRWMTIVGVVRNVKHNRLDEKPDLQVYEPFARAPWRSSYIVVRTDGPSPETVAAQLRRAVAALDATIPLFEVHTLQSAVDASLSTRRLTNLLLGAFAAAALVLAAIGIYGVISLSVTGRLKEFGIRLALGAPARNVTRLVLRQGLLLALAGVTIGLLGAIAVTRYLRALLFGVQPLDWPTFSAVALLLTATALAACWIPSRRAMRSDPIDVLRTE